MSKKLYMWVGATILLVLIVDFAFVHPHHIYFPWQKVAGLDLGFGLLGAFLLMFFSLGLGEYFLWKSTCSVVLDEKDSGFGYRTATLRAWLAADGARVTQGQPLAELENARGDRFTIAAPLGGKVSKCFLDPGEEVNVGETVVDLHVSKHDLHALHEGHGEEGSHA